MSSIPVGAPSNDDLCAGLTNLASLCHGRPVVLVERRRNCYASTFASEIVTVETELGRRTLFCKHGANYVDPVIGVERGVPYEASIYQLVIGPLHGPAPSFEGSFAGAHGTTIVLAYRDDATQLHHTEPGTQSAIVRAASVLGSWHARSGSVALDQFRSFVNEMDASAFEQWSACLTERSPADPGWAAIAELVHSGDSMPALIEAPKIIIHGELFTSNVLVGAQGEIEFVDWETCAVGPGELDLASLTVGNWPAATRAACETAYVDARFDGSAPLWFDSVLTAAHLYVLEQVARHRVTRGVSPWDDPVFRSQVAAIADGARS